MTGPGKRSARRPADLAYADTNLFIGLIAGPANRLHEPALAIFRRVADGDLALIVTPIVVAEIVYVVRSLMGWTRAVTAERVAGLLEADGLVLTEGPTLLLALRLFGARSKLDFADAYLAAIALEVGPAVVASFDGDLGGIDGVRRIAE